MLNVGNSVALAALLAWPLVVFALFRMLTIERALIWTILGGYLLLPQMSEINFPGVTAFDKRTIPNLAAFVGCMLMLGRFPRLLPQSWLASALLLMVMVSPVITVLTNLEPVEFGVRAFGTLEMFDASELEQMALPGLRIYDSASALSAQIFLMLPFFLARAILDNADALREIVAALVIAGLIYALPMLFEVRFSPQLHSWVYGFFQHDFIQAIRWGGYRPFVFMPHGIWVALFAFMCAMAAAIMLRTAEPAQRGRKVLILMLMLLLLLICKTLGPILFALVFVPIVLILNPRHHIRFAAAIALVVLSYPLLRGAGLVPIDRIVGIAAAFDPERAASLAYRIENEERVLEHVADKLLFGWGGWGRFIPHAQETGTSDVVVDGTWIITIGHFGWVGYVATFGLLTLPLLSLWWHARKPHAPAVSLPVSGLALILAVNLLDMLLNDTLIPFTWLMAGAVLGYSETLGRTAEENRLAALQARHASMALSTAPATTPGAARRSLL
ncbi:MAG: O-antigen ligase like membrane protein [Rhodobacteraceae bacterium HLUCCA12]|nr:MAG: O-antigen ligase like membrane protein [Rhodobacteraceae bacterium HLUCCA12]